MMKRNFLLLALLTLFAVAMLAVLAPMEDSADKSSTDSLWLPAVAENVNEVDRVEIIAAGNRPVATLLRTGEGWQLEQMGGYQANWSKLQTLLAELAQAQVIEVKTDKPEYYARLGVGNIDSEDAGGVLVSLGIGDQPTGILIGKRAQGRQGRYVRLQDQGASALVDRELDVSTDTLEWAETSILDVNSSEVAEVEIIHPSSERILVMRISADQTDFDLAGLPPGREVKSSWAVNSLGSVFAMLDWQTVRPDTGVDWSEAIRMRMLMFSGVEILADVIEAGDEFLLRLQASHPAAKVAAREDSASSEQQGPELQSVEKQVAEDIAKMVADINRKTAGWVYGITKQKYDAMVKKPEDLLKPLESS